MKSDECGNVLISMWLCGVFVYVCSLDYQMRKGASVGLQGCYVIVLGVKTIEVYEHLPFYLVTLQVCM